MDAKQIADNPREVRWLNIMEVRLEELPDTAEGAWEKLKPELDLSKFRPEEYELK